MSLKYNYKLISRARDLRSNATRQENRLWYDFLSKYHVRFQRQKVIGNFIVDFYCHQAKLVVEIDGKHHYTDSGLEYDLERTAAVSEFDLHVIRFSNDDVDKNFDGVCKSIDEAIIKAHLLEGGQLSPWRKQGGALRA